MNNNKKFRNGFSLIEVMIVVLIIGIVTLVAVPRYQDYWTRHSLKSACKRIASDLKYAQSHALTTSQSVDVNFFISPGNYYSVPTIESEADEQLEYSVSLGGAPYRSSIHSANFDGDGVVVFNAFGNPDSSGSVVLSAGNYFQSVIVTSTGGVSLGSQLIGVTPELVDGEVGVDAL